MKKYKIKLIEPVLGVPVTFIEHYPPPQPDRRRLRLDIVGFRNGTDGKDLTAEGVYKYSRYLITVRSSS